MKRYFAIVFTLAFLLQACGLPIGSSAKVDANGTQATADSTEPSSTGGSTAVQHKIIPNVGAERGALGHDNDETKIFEQRTVTAGDDFLTDRFERPFTANVMDYLPYVDIKDFSMMTDEHFYYIEIVLAGVDSANQAPGMYGAEIDFNADGRADLLVLAQSPKSSQWTTDEVAVYTDENGDVGGTTLKPDKIYAGNGFEKEIFKNGQGVDPDLAWARFVNNKAPIVELALRFSDSTKDLQFLWSVLASANPVDPQKFYFNDTLTLERAGVPEKGDANYPVKELAAYDDTCRLPFGFEAKGDEPLGCATTKIRPDFSQPQPCVKPAGAATLSVIPSVPCR